MALPQESLFSLIDNLKHNTYDFWIQNWDTYGPMFFRWLGRSLAEILTFQWVGWLIHLPVVRPDALASILHESTFPPTTQYSTSLATVPGLMTINNVIPITGANNQFVLGVMNSPALVISISTTTVFCFRWLCIDEIRWGSLLAFFGNFLGNWLVIVAVLFGLDEIVAHWYFLTPFTYIGGIFFIWRLIWKWIRIGRRFDAELIGPFGMNPVTWRGIKMGLTGFALGLTEQTVLFQKLVQPLSPEQLHLLHGFSSGTVRDHILMHGSYVTGLFVGGFLLGSLILAILVPAADWLCNEGWVTDAKLLLVIVIMTGTSLPYYGIDYLVFRFTNGHEWQGQHEPRLLNRSNSPKPTKIKTQEVRNLEGETMIITNDPKVNVGRAGWQDYYRLYPERKWFEKVQQESDLPLFSLKAALDAYTMTGKAITEPFRMEWKSRLDSFDPEAPISSKDRQEGWNAIRDHFYTWTDEQIFRLKLQAAMKTELRQARYRMIRLRDVYDRIYVMKNDKITVQDFDFRTKRTIKPPSDAYTQFGGSDFEGGVDEYFDWVLQLTPKFKLQQKILKSGPKGLSETRLPSDSDLPKEDSTSTSMLSQKEGVSPDEDSRENPQEALEAKSSTSIADLKSKPKSTLSALIRERFMWARKSDIDKARKEAAKLSELEGKPKVINFSTLKYENEEKQEAMELQRGWSYLHSRFWKARAYSHFMFRRLLELEVDSLVARQPSRNFITDAESTRLQYHKVALAAYHRGLRAYQNSLSVSMLDPRGNRLEDEYWRSDTWGNWKLGWRAKSLENYVYAQQFKGSQRVIQRLFLLDVDWNPWDGQTFRYDQLLPLEDQDKGDRSNLWHEELPQSLREKVGAYDPFHSKRVSPMFDPVPFYIGWDPVMRKSVLTTSRMPYGTAHVKLTLPVISSPAAWDFLGIKRFLEETKLYEYLDFLADEDHEFFVYVKDKLDPTVVKENKEKSKKYRKTKEELEEVYKPSSVRVSPTFENNTVKILNPRVTKLLSSKYRYELYLKLQKIAKEAKAAKEEGRDYPYQRITPGVLKGFKQEILVDEKVEEAARLIRQSQKPLVTERAEPFVDVRSPATWFKAVPQSIQKTSDVGSEQSRDESDSHTDSNQSTDESESDEDSDDE